jgi:hypothetical protein
MSTKEFNDLAKSRLTDNGAYAVNFISALEGENSMFFQGMLRTFIQTFPNYYVFAYGNNDIQAQNIVLVGINSNNIKDTEKIITKVSLIEEKGDYFSKKIIRNPQQFLKDPSIGVLTDNFSPVEKLMLPLIKNYFPLHARYYQDML